MYFTRMVMTRCPLILGLCLCLVSCIYGRYNLIVEPVKSVECTKNMGPGTSCGAVPTSPYNAEAYIVDIGNERKEYQEAMESEMKLSYEEYQRRIEEFAIKVVIDHGYCDTARVSENAVVIHYGGHFRIPVTCID